MPTLNGQRNFPTTLIQTSRLEKGSNFFQKNFLRADTFMDD